jgi:PAS domain S-box-containing protein
MDGDGPAGAVVLQCDAREFLYPLVRGWPTPSATAETLFVRREGETVLYLSELRHRKDAPLQFRIPLTQRDMPAVMAALGREGLVEGTDYRGSRVLAVLCAVPDSPWRLVTKKDTAEAFAPLRQHAWTTVAIVGLMILAVALALALVWHWQTRAEALREREELLSVTLHSIGDGVLTTDAEGRVTRLNSVAEQLTGWPEAEAKGRPADEVFRIINEETRRPAVLPVEDVLRTGAIHGLANHTVLIARDGAERAIADSAAPIRDPDGRLLGIVLVFRDVTTERRAEREIRRLNETLEQRVRERTAELRETEERFRLLVEAVTEYAILMLDPEGRVVSWNAGAERVQGYRAEEVVGRHFSLFYPPEDVAAGKPQRELEVAAATGRFEDEGWRVRKDGSRFIADTVISAVRDGAGPLRGFAKITRDITERRRAEESLRSLNAELEQRVAARTRELASAKEVAEAASRAKSEFLANVSHEVRTPMNAIMGMTDLVLETPLTAEQRRFLTTVRESADSLLGVLNDILDFSKIEAGRLELEEMPFSVREVIEGTAIALAERAQCKGLELACHVTSEVPETLVGDAGRVRQILVNLIGNAIKFTERGEVVVRAGIEAAEARDVTLHCSVTDTGIGIPSDKQRIIFDAFRQADASVSRQFGGTGLGLAICAQLAARMRGRIWVESQVGRGSVFHVTARLGVAQDARPQAPVSLTQLRGLRVLIVDDNATNRLIYEEQTTAWGLRPTAVESSEQALAAVEAALGAGDPYALVLLDRQMPEMDGYQFTERLRSRPELGTPTVLMLSSTGDLGDAERRRELGIAACLVKPVRQSELLNTIMRVMGLAATAKHKPAEAPAARPLRILLAEDYPLNQELAVQLLERRGHTVVVAANGVEALRRLEAEDFDVVLMDIQMPVMDGYAATAAIRDPKSAVRRHDIPIVATTAHAMKGDRDRCLAAGMNGYVSKPFTAAELTGALAEVSGAALPAAGSQPRPSPAPAVFDRSALLRNTDGDAGLADRIAGCFVEDAAERLAGLETAAATGDAETLLRLVHTLKGAAALVGGLRARAVCQRAETALRNGEVAAATGLVAGVTAEIRALAQAIREGGGT